MKKRIILIGSILLVAVVLFVVFSGSGKKKYEFRFDKASQGDITMNVTATGTINAVTSVEVGTQVSGIISKLYADFNSVVKEGQLIAQIDPTFLQQAVKDASASLERARAQFADAKRTLERTKSLFDKNLESQANYDAAVTQFESSQAALKQAEASLDRAKINLAYATIYAPINGVVIDRKVNVGQTVAASFSSPTLYTIANDLRKMQVQATIDESDIGKISIGQEATFTVDAYPEDRFRGTVSQIRLAPVSIQNVVNYTVIVDCDNDQLKLMPGMTANVRVVVGTASNVLRVPNMALRFQPPVDLVDSTKIKNMREAGFGSGMGGERGHQMGDGGNGQTSSGPMGGRGDRSGGGMGGDRWAKMKAIRDSITAAHGGEISEEELRGEMRKVFEKTRQGGGQPRTAEAPQPFKRTATGGRYGIQNNFPEYQKSAFVVSHQTGRGRVWVLNATGKLEPVFVTTGLTDGRYTEVKADSLKPGDQLVLGATSNSDAPTAQTTNPLAPSGGQGQRPMGGGPR
jgi:HlyD family secretion protein